MIRGSPPLRTLDPLHLRRGCEEVARGYPPQAVAVVLVPGKMALVAVGHKPAGHGHGGTPLEFGAFSPHVFVFPPIKVVAGK